MYWLTVLNLMTHEGLFPSPRRLYCRPFWLYKLFMACSETQSHSCQVFRFSIRIRSLTEHDMKAITAHSPSEPIQTVHLIIQPLWCSHIQPNTPAGTICTHTRQHNTPAWAPRMTQMWLSDHALNFKRHSNRTSRLYLSGVYFYFDIRTNLLQQTPVRGLR